MQIIYLLRNKIMELLNAVYPPPPTHTPLIFKSLTDNMDLKTFKLGAVESRIKIDY